MGISYWRQLCIILFSLIPEYQELEEATNHLAEFCLLVWGVTDLFDVVYSFCSFTVLQYFLSLLTADELTSEGTSTICSLALSLFASWLLSPWSAGHWTFLNMMEYKTTSCSAWTTRSSWALCALVILVILQFWLTLCSSISPLIFLSISNLTL